MVACSAERAASSAVPRVVSLHDVTTEIIVALGAVDHLVGVQEPVDLDGAARAAVAGVPRVADLETILVARPDVVVGLGVVAEQSPELVSALRARGVTVELADPATLDDVAALVGRTGARLHVADRVAAVAARLQPPPLARSRPPAPVFVYDCCDPPFTAGGRTVLTDVIARAGGRNVFADLDADWASVSWEAAAARRPALVVVHDYRYRGQEDVAGKRAALRRIPGLGDVPVVELPLRWSLGGLGSVHALARLRTVLEGIE